MPVLSKVTNIISDKVKDERTRLLYVNIFYGIIIRVLNAAIGFLLVPICIDFVGQSNYGLWLTVGSIVLLFNMFDFGLTNGLRNRFTEAKANNDNELAKIYISTTFFFFTVLYVFLGGILLIINKYVDWSFILDESIRNVDVSPMVVLIIIFFCVYSLLKVVGTILTADQRPSVAALFDLLSQVFCLLGIWVVSKHFESDVIYLVWVFGAAPIIAWLIGNIWVFGGRYRAYVPSLRSFRFSKIKDLLNLGIKFFVIQVAVAIQYQTANFIIAIYFTTADVTYYNIVYKYFGIVTMMFPIFIAPLWSATTDAYSKNDFKWIQKTTNFFLRIATVFAIGAVLMVLVSRFVFDLWLGKDIQIHIDSELVYSCCLYTVVTLYLSIYVNLLNGMGILKVQFLTALISPALFLGMIYFFVKIAGWGIASLFIALTICNLNGFIAPFQFYRIMKSRMKQT